MDLFSFMPVTFIFDLKDEAFLKDLWTFIRYFHYVEVANELVEQKRLPSVDAVDADTLVRTAERDLFEKHRKSIKNRAGVAGGAVGVSGGAKTPKATQAVEVKDVGKTEESDKSGVLAKPADEGVTEVAAQIEGAQVEPELTEDKETSLVATDTTPLPEPPRPSPDKPDKPDKAEPQEATKRPSKSPMHTGKRPSLQTTQNLPSDADLEVDRLKKQLERLRNPIFTFDTYYLPVVKNKAEHKVFIDYSRVKPSSCQVAGSNIWILKVAGMNRGFGVEVFETLEQLKKLLKDIATGYQERIVQDNKEIARSQTFIKTSKFVIQKYIERPLLYRGRKMDLRVWVMFTHELRPFIFRECYVRLSSAPFNMQRLSEKFVHLTNNALQKYSDQYDEDETLKSTQELEDYLRERVRPGYSFKRDTWPTIRKMVRLTFNCCSKGIAVGAKKLCFEIYGYDFMMDEDFRVWLIETNTNPSITTPGAILKAYVPRMIDDGFRLTVDKVFPPKDFGGLQDAPPQARRPSHEVLTEDKPPGDATEQPPHRRTFPLPGYDDADNLWDPIDDKI